MSKFFISILINIILLNQFEEKLRLFIKSGTNLMGDEFKYNQNQTEVERSIIEEYLQKDLSGLEKSLEKDFVLKLNFYQHKHEKLSTTMYILEGWMPNLYANEVFEFSLNFNSPMHTQNTHNRLSTQPQCLNDSEDIQMFQMNPPIISKRQMLIHKKLHSDLNMADVNTIEDERYPAPEHVVRATMSKRIIFRQDGKDVQFRDVSLVDMKGWVAPWIVDFTMAEQLTKEMEINYQSIKAHLIIYPEDD